ncbi:MAG: small multi-drug export protein [Candidatus Cloacimonetes bacterium]|nr:small multi-drug export protein [Candidatus Cloacimonadota bacterium]
MITFVLAFSAEHAEDIEPHGFKAKLEGKINSINVSNEMKVFVISMIPIFELRGAIPIGLIRYKLPLWKVFPIAIAGNMIPIFFILLFFDLITKLFFKVSMLKKLLEAIFERTRKKGALIEKYEELGLMLFVAIPLPITGAWTGSLAAYLFGLSFWKSTLFIFLGVVTAAIIVSILSLMGWCGAIIALSALIILIISSIIKSKIKGI